MAWWRAVRSRPRRARTVLSVLLGVLAVAAVASAPEAFGGFGATVGGTGQTASGTLVLADTTAGSTCTSAPDVAGGLAGDTAVCPTSLLAPKVGASRTVTVANEGSLTPSSATLSTGGSCGVEKLADAATGSGDPGLVVGGTTVGVPGPPALAGSKAVAFDGSSGYAETVAGPTQSFDAAPGPQTFSIAAWFETTTGGSVIGFTDSQSDANQTTWDRQLWVDPSGHVVFGLYPNRIFELSSAQTTAKDYADGSWHLAVVTVKPVTTTSATVELYVDGQLVAGGRRDEAITSGQPAQDYGGYWHLGWSGAATGWPDPPASAFWQGGLAQVAVFPTALSGSQVRSLSHASTDTAYATAVTGGVAAANAYWPLAATQVAGFPCDLLAVTVQLGAGPTARCLAPAGSGPCPAPASGDPPDVVTSLPTGGGTLIFTTGTTGPVPAAARGLHLVVPWQLVARAGSFSAQLDHPDTTVEL